MEANNQDRVKDLQYFLNAVSVEKGYVLNSVYMGPVCIEAAERYAAHLIQQAKDAAFKKGVKSERIRVRKILKSHYPGAKMDSQTVLSVLHDNAPMPYTTGEKGGEDTSQTT